MWDSLGTIAKVVEWHLFGFNPLMLAKIILGVGLANERQYNIVILPFIGLAPTQNDPCICEICVDFCGISSVNKAYVCINAYANWLISIF